MASRTFSSFALDGKPQAKTFAANIGHSVAFPQCKCPFARALLTMVNNGEANSSLEAELPQRSLKSPIACVGKGSNGQRKVVMTLRPALPDSGLVFRRVDLGVGVRTAFKFAQHFEEPAVPVGNRRVGLVCPDQTRVGLHALQFRRIDAGSPMAGEVRPASRVAVSRPGTSMRGMVVPISFSIASTRPPSDGEARGKEWPVLPARPVRPMRWT